MATCISYESNEGALGYATPETTDFYVLTDLSAPYTLMPSLSQTNIRRHSSGLANGIISYKN